MTKKPERQGKSRSPFRKFLPKVIHPDPLRPTGRERPPKDTPGDEARGPRDSK